MDTLGLLDNIDQLAPKKIGIEEFTESDDYAGIALYPRQLVLLKLIFLEEMSGPEEDVLDEWINGGRNGSEIILSPNIRERRDYLRDNGYSHFREVQMAVGRRASKGFTTGTSMAYKMWNTLQLGSPGEFYGIDRKKEIYFSCIAGSENQAKKFQYSDMVARIESNRAFQPYISDSLETEIRIMTPADIREAAAAGARGLKVRRDQARLRGNALAANAGTLRGSATMALVIDEAAHMIAGESKSSAQEVYNAAGPSLDQFGIDGMMFINSSPYSKVGMFHDLYIMGLKPFDPTRPVDLITTELFGDDSDMEATINGDPRRLVFQGPSWALFEGYRYYKSSFKPRTRGNLLGKMVTVSPDWDPEDVDDQGRELFSKEDRAAIIQARASEAADPETYKVERRGKFAEISEAWLNPSMVDRMYQGRPIGLMPIPNSPMGDMHMAYEPFGINNGVGVNTGAHRYKFHLDPSSTTAGFGFAIGHIEYLPDPLTGVDTEHVIFDLIKRWNPQTMPNKVIKWKPILDEIMTWAKIFTPFEITMDQHQSMAPLQDLQDRLNQANISCQVYMRPSPQPLDAKLLTPSGWVTMGDIKIGDHVYGSDGEAHPVVKLVPAGKRPIYRVYMVDGGYTECTDDHTWAVRSRSKRGKLYELTLNELIQKGIRYDSGLTKWQVPLAKPLEFLQNEELPIDPYLMGSLLGDGCFNKSVTIACHNDDVNEQAVIFRQMLPEGMSISFNPGKGNWTRLYFKKPDGMYKNPLCEKIRKLGLWHVKGVDKFIPDIYMKASIDDRIALLQGLIDTDGNVRKGRHGVRFTNISHILAQQVVDLVGSLGGVANIQSNKGTRTLNVSIMRLPHEVIPCRLQRKVDLYRPIQRGGRYRYISHVEYVGEKESQCIGVDNDDHLYITDNYILTHNTAELNWKKCEVFKTALYQGLVHAPNNEEAQGSPPYTSKDELKFLQQIQTISKFPRVEKQDIGPVQTKDMADAIIDVVWALMGSLQIQTMRERLSQATLAGGSPGGYGLGQRNYPNGSPMPMNADGSYYYSQGNMERARADQLGIGNPARGAIGMRRGTRGRR